MLIMSNKVNNFQEEFSIHDIEVARDVKATHDCGMSRIALKAPEQIYCCYKRLMQEPDCACIVELNDVVVKPLAKTMKILIETGTRYGENL